jgi:hypothetical protein
MVKIAEDSWQMHSSNSKASDRKNKAPMNDGNIVQYCLLTII